MSIILVHYLKKVLILLMTVLKSKYAEETLSFLISNENYLIWPTA